MQQAIGAVSMRIRWRTGQGAEQQLEGVHPDQDPGPLVWLVNYLRKVWAGHVSQSASDHGFIWRHNRVPGRRSPVFPVLLTGPDVVAAGRTATCTPI